MTPTEELVKYVKDNGIKQQHIIDKTNISRNVLYPVFIGKRTLRDWEYLSICKCINVDPMMFYHGDPSEEQANDQN